MILLKFGNLEVLAQKPGVKIKEIDGWDIGIH